MVHQRINGSPRNNIGEIIPHIVQTACTFKSSITFEVDEKHVNAKSIMGVMALASTNSSDIRICVEGEDEKDALKAITGLFQ